MENADLKSQLKERDARIAKLESVLEESRRAGKRQAAPFSKDKPKRDPKKPGRKPGSKYGRQAVRAIPVPDKTFEAPCPEQCPCGGKVGAEGSIDLYQVDIPPIQPETWKFVVGHGHCQECGRRVRGQHPLLISKAFEVGTVHFGPRLLAFAAFQKMICGVSYDKIRLGFEQMLGFPVARSTLCRAMQRLARRAKPTRDALVEALRASPVVYADETGWKQGGRRVWLWVFTNLRETVYEILPGRGFEQAASVLGKNYAGTLGVDGWAPYRCFKEATLQTCYNQTELVQAEGSIIIIRDCILSTWRCSEDRLDSVRAVLPAFGGKGFSAVAFYEEDGELRGRTLFRSSGKDWRSVALMNRVFSESSDAP